jgi:hypothetical protein
MSLCIKENKMDIREEELKNYEALAQAYKELSVNYERQIVARDEIISLLKKAIHLIIDMLTVAGRMDLVNRIEKNLTHILE